MTKASTMLLMLEAGKSLYNLGGRQILDAQRIAISLGNQVFSVHKQVLLERTADRVLRYLGHPRYFLITPPLRLISIPRACQHHARCPDGARLFPAEQALLHHLPRDLLESFDRVHAQVQLSRISFGKDLGSGLSNHAPSLVDDGHLELILGLELVDFSVDLADRTAVHSKLSAQLLQRPVAVALLGRNVHTGGHHDDRLLPLKLLFRRQFLK